MILIFGRFICSSQAIKKRECSESTHVSMRIWVYINEDERDHHSYEHNKAVAEQPE